MKVYLRLVDASGRTATLPLGADGRLAAWLPGQFTKGRFLMPTRESEPTLVTYTLPTSALRAAGVTRPVSATLVVESPGAVGIYVDNPVRE